MPGRLGGGFVDVKILRMIDVVSFVMHAHYKGFVVFPVRKSGQTKEPGDIRGCRIAAVLRGQSTQERFRLARIEAVDAPDDLMFSGGCIENEIRRRNVAGGTDRLKRSAGFLVEVEISVPYLANLFFGPVSRPFSYWIHSDENVGSRLVLLVKPGLKRRTCDCLGWKNSLDRLVLSAIPDQHRDLIAWLVKSEHVFRRRQEAWRE